MEKVESALLTINFSEPVVKKLCEDEYIDFLTNLTGLDYLDISNNKIRNLKELKFRNIDTLIIYNNPIIDWSQIDSMKASMIIKTEEEYWELIKRKNHR